MISELESHYRRLSRVNGGSLWKRAFAGAAAVLLGGVTSALLAHVGWTPAVKSASGFFLLCLIAWYAVHETESETLSAICDDYKRDILDSIEFEDVEGGNLSGSGMVRRGER